MNVEWAVACVQHVFEAWFWFTGHEPGIWWPILFLRIVPNMPHHKGGRMWINTWWRYGTWNRLYESNRDQNHVTDYMRRIFAHVGVIRENCWVLTNASKGLKVQRDSMWWWTILKISSTYKYCIYCTLQRKSRLCIPFLGIARPQFQFSNSCVWERFIYSQDRSTYFLQQNRQIDSGNI